MTCLSKTASVLTLEALSDKAATYARIAEEDEGVERLRIVSIDRQVYDDLGRAQTITVTIEPGNTLEDL